MNSKPILVSKGDISFLVLLLILVIGAFIYAVFSLIDDINNLPYLDLTGCIIVVLLFGSAACLFRLLRFNSELRLYDGELVFISFLGCRLYSVLLSDIKEYEIEYKESKGTEWECLTIHTNTDSYRINSSGRKNYEALKAAIIRDAEIDGPMVESRFIRRSRRWGFFLCIVGPALFVTSLFLYDPTIYKERKLLQIRDVITSKIEISGGGKSGKSIQIRLQRFPRMHFSVSGKRLKIMNKDKFLAEVYTGDTITVSMLADEYQSKIELKGNPDFWTRHFRFNHIKVYGLKKGYDEFLPIHDYYEEERTDGEVVYIVCIIGMFMTGAGLYRLNLRSR